MIEITKLAAEKLSAYLSENNIDSPVRIVTVTGCGGLSLGLALDERKASDYVQEDEAFTLLIEQNLSESCGNVTIDYIEKTSGCGCGEAGGFSVKSETPLPRSNSGCGGSCSSSGCGC